MSQRKRSKSRTTPRQYSLVRFRFDDVPAEYHSKYPFTVDGVYVFFGDIPNMPGHCVVADHRTGQIYSGYHTENFMELSEDEA
jgi:hypothetical protein